MNKNSILSEYYKAEVWYNAMLELLKAEGITIENDSSALNTGIEPIQPTSSQTSTENKPEQYDTESHVSVSTKPEIVYNGQTAYTLSRGEKISLCFDINNVTSSKDYKIVPYSSPSYTYSIAGKKTSTGFRVTIDIKASLIPGQGMFKIYLVDDPESCLDISLAVK